METALIHKNSQIFTLLPDFLHCWVMNNPQHVVTQICQQQQVAKAVMNSRQTEGLFNF